MEPLTAMGLAALLILGCVLLVVGALLFRRLFHSLYWRVVYAVARFYEDGPYGPNPQAKLVVDTAIRIVVLCLITWAVLTGVLMAYY
jgi:hypothetical protein